MKSDDDDISTSSNSEHTQSFEAGGSESESLSEVENESDPWEPLIEEAKENTFQTILNNSKVKIFGKNLKKTQKLQIFFFNKEKY